MPKVVIYIAAGFLLLGISPFPYGYYMLLRLIAFGVFTWAAYITFEKNEVVLPWVFVILALVFNPILQIHFPKGIWAVIDFSSGLFLVAIKRKIQEAD
jgi:succinate-acetate transporter protein